MKLIKNFLLPCVGGLVLYLLSTMFSFINHMDLESNIFMFLCYSVIICCLVIPFLVIWYNKEALATTVLSALMLLISYMVLFSTCGKLVLWLEDLFNIVTDNASGLMFLSCFISILFSCVVSVLIVTIRALIMKRIMNAKKK